MGGTRKVWQGDNQEEHAFETTAHNRYSTHIVDEYEANHYSDEEFDLTQQYMGEYETSGNYNQEEDMDNNEHQEENDDYENFEQEDALARKLNDLGESISEAIAYQDQGWITTQL
jgi:hypothetical protein